MNFRRSKCYSCRADVLVNQREWNDVWAHVCVACTANIKTLYTTDEQDELGADSLLEGLRELTELEDIDIIDNDFEGLDSSDRKCECGATKAGAPGHSSWCPMYQPK